jgi:CBS domain-containing protein
MLQRTTTESEEKKLAKRATVGQVLSVKGNEVISIRPEQSVLEAIEVFVKHSVGALLVTDSNDEIVGILTERDILRANARSFDRMSGFKVSDLMTREVIIGLTEDSLDYVMDLMTERRIRHLPILERSGELTGILSIGDVVKARARHAEVEIRYLTDYITGQYPV